MIKTLKLGTGGMLKDMSKKEFPSKMFYDAWNVRLVAVDSQSTYAITNEFGTDLFFTFPSLKLNTTANQIINTTIGGDGYFNPVTYTVDNPTDPFPRNEIEAHFMSIDVGSGLWIPETGGDQILIGNINSRNGIILFSTDNQGFDCIWELNVNGERNDSLNPVLTLKYMRNMGFSTSKPIQAIYNYENTSIEKVYWVDGFQQIRSINLRQSIINGDITELIDLPVKSIESVGDFNMSQPEIVSISNSGTHTAGMIQYAYNLYMLNGSQTQISPLTDLVPLAKTTGAGGGAVNEIVSASPTIEINDIDTSYTHLKLYAIKYTSFNETPQVSLIYNQAINNYNSFQFTDTGSIISTLSLEEFLFLGSAVRIPKHIETKHMRLFAFNITEEKFDFKLDMRAYAHDATAVAKIRHGVFINGSGDVDSESLITVNSTTFIVDEKNDSVNADYDIYKFQKNATTIGSEGKYIKFEIEQTTLSESEAINYRFLKDREIYRFAIEFYNTKGQRSSPSWCCDLKMPFGNLSGNYNKLKTTLTADFYTYVNSLPVEERPVGYRILRSDRTVIDRTIICQGVLNPMIANVKHTTKEVVPANIDILVEDPSCLKMPSVMRPLSKSGNMPFIGAKHNHELAYTDYNDNTFAQLAMGLGNEGTKSAASGNWRAQNFQFNRMMQIFSPEITFGNPIFDASMKLKLVGTEDQEDIEDWAKELNPVSGTAQTDIKFIGGASSVEATTTITTTGNAVDIADKSFFGPTNGTDTTGVFQIYRKFKDYRKADNATEIIPGFPPTTITLPDPNSYNIYNKPEVTEWGQGVTAYNGDERLRYANSLRSMLIDDFTEGVDGCNIDCAVQILGSNTYGARCATIVLGSEVLTNVTDAITFESLFYATGASDTVGSLDTAINRALITEVIRDSNYTYVGGIYGGNTMYNKANSSYMAIGDYALIDSLTPTQLIKSPGDTYVQEYIFEKMSKTETQLGAINYTQVTEIISVKVETLVDLKNRNDLSLFDWDNKFQPQDTEYHQYNSVYTQEPNLIQSTGLGLDFKKIKVFDTKIIASSVKTPGETVDSWTNFLDNETMVLEGTYGPINGVRKLNDEVYTFQDTAVAVLSINPRAAVQANDGISLALGTGKVLDDHKYITTNSGTKNKWAVTNSSQAIYYYDTFNRSINMIGQGMGNLTESNGFRSFMYNNTDLDNLSTDNPVIRKGVSSGYDPVNGDIYFSFLNEGNDFTIAYNESMKVFTSFYSYVPSMYLFKSQKMITPNPTGNSLWKHFSKNNRNSFYGVSSDSTIEYIASPPTDSDVVYGNLEYKMESKDESGDSPNKTFYAVQTYNEYQDTNKVILNNRANISRKFRSWKITLPRDKKNANKRDRLRSNALNIKLFWNTDLNESMIMHDLNVSYTEY